MSRSLTNLLWSLFLLPVYLKYLLQNFDRRVLESSLWLLVLQEKILGTNAGKQRILRFALTMIDFQKRIGNMKQQLQTDPPKIVVCFVLSRAQEAKNVKDA